MKVLTIVGLAVGLAGCDYSSADCDARKVEIAQQTAQILQQTEFQKRLFALQEQVAKDCSARGNVPVFSGGNVGCQVIAKKESK